MNYFKQDLQYSYDLRDDLRLTDFYKNIFPNLNKIELVDDLSLQKRGIDKIIHFNNENKIYIDEKKGEKIMEIFYLKNIRFGKAKK